MSWLLLAVAIVFEVAATLSLRVAATGRCAWYAAVAAGYLVAFGFLSLTLSTGMPLGIAYGVWTASGIVLTALLSKLLFDEALTAVMALGMALIVGGVLMVELGSAA